MGLKSILKSYFLKSKFSFTERKDVDLVSFENAQYSVTLVVVGFSCCEQMYQ